MSKLKQRSKPTNAYELMKAAIYSMQAKPQTYVQEFFLSDGKELLKKWGRERCDTAFCCAGHIVMTYNGELPIGDDMINDRTTKLLGLQPQEVRSLFAGSALWHSNGLYSGLGLPIDFNSDPREYIRRGIEGMRVFMKRYEAQLGAHKLGES